VTAAGTRVAPAGIVSLLLLTGLFAVWAWQYGGWFGTALYPGTVVLAAGLVLLALFAPVRFRLRGWPAVALGALIALGLWSALSALWSPAPDVAIEDAQRILAYAMAFGLGLWMCTLLGSRLHLAMAPVAFAGLFAGIVALIGILAGDNPRELLDEGTLQYPFGYRNANAAFFLIAAWPAVGLAASRGLDWRLRGLALATATLCFQLAALGQSRGSVLGVAAALIVYLLVSDDRARGVGWLLLAVIPALVVVPALTDLYQAVDEVGSQDALPELRAAGRTVIGGSALALLLGLGAALLERRYPPSPALLRRANRGVAVAAALIAAAGVAGFVVTTGNPAGWIGDRADEFLTQGSPQGGAGSSRFGFNAGTERDDLWRVALDDAGEDPVLGTGAGGYYYSYLRNRTGEGVESAQDAHSVELEFLGELGSVGLALFLVVLVASVGAALRARRLGGEAAALVTIALTAAAYWLAHSSLDWFFPFPAITAPVLMLLGAAGAPALAAGASPSRWGRRAVVAAAVVLALSVVAPYLSQRYIDQAYNGWRGDIEKAYEDLDRAAQLNPLAEEPLLAEGGIAQAAGDRDRAIDALERAAAKRPEEWATHYFLARLYAGSEPAMARRELEFVRTQNPLSPRVEELEVRLRAADAP
jgi:O-Antigen ligase